MVNFQPSFGKANFAGFSSAPIYIIQFHAHDYTSVAADYLLPLLPNLRTLILREATIQGISKKNRSASPCPELNALHFLSCVFHLDGFCWLLSGRNMREVVIWDCQIIDGKGHRHPAEEFRPKLTEICPLVQLLDKSDYQSTIKIEGWGEDMKDRIISAAFRPHSAVHPPGRRMGFMNLGAR
ncbi:hypothetical protein V565_211710 [Rhizoctonia solani 123E]|uniref:Uncharacterized protein n=1 Tax=Rhizoctonia solani 123E TaxID=1423351 RepID=A0A074RLM0_9AGAM|nr:hypothetical protein V565_211710 [Rhizoctonia solani 123E]